MDDFVKKKRSEIDMKPGETKAVSPERWKIIKAIHLIAPSNEQVSFSMKLAIQRSLTISCTHNRFTEPGN